MIGSLDELSTILRDTKLSSRELDKVDILNNEEQVLIVKVDPSNSLESWEILRNLIPRTGRAPIIRDDYEAITFSRKDYEFEYGNGSHDSSPRSIISRAELLELEAVVDSYHRAAISDAFGEDPEEIIGYELNITEKNFNQAPSLSDVLRAMDGQPINRVSVEQFLFNWELEHVDPDRWRETPKMVESVSNW